MSESDRKMNDTTMPPRAARRLEKAARRKGFGLSDWNRLVANSKDLAMRNGAPLRRIRWSEIRQHNSVHDGWLVLKGKVYFISPYLPYHPGGVNILKPVLGKDGTALYEKYHRWVNEDNLISKLLIGYLDSSPSDSEDEEEEDGPSYALPTAVQAKTEDGFAVPLPRKPKP